MKIDHCRRCSEPGVSLVKVSGELLCPKCAKVSIRFSRASANHFRSKIYPVTEIDIDCHLDMIVGQIMAFYITNGMSVRQVACQLGITHATVYSKLRKTGLMKPPTQADTILNPTLADFSQGGGFGTEFIIIQKSDEYRKLNKLTKNPKKPKPL